jgi:hypothetical protein
MSASGAARSPASGRRPQEPRCAGSSDLTDLTLDAVRRATVSFLDACIAACGPLPSHARQSIAVDAEHRLVPILHALLLQAMTPPDADGNPAQSLSAHFFLLIFFFDFFF